MSSIEAGSIEDSTRTSWFGYCMSKAALNMQSKLVYNRIKEGGGHVLVLHPGRVQTYMQGKLDAEGDFTPDRSAIALIEMMERQLVEVKSGARPELMLLNPDGSQRPW
ncbi:hypothetical protein [Paenibacillus sp. Leaf72]|uniref:hypothetical protein n=1 Tax=Paenibacillus sp. Leaf72 TaxID=1736234 RepID=UPI0006FBF32E|nr:hypothetical protein [Paenibacillus sp. Leaf72]KQN97065.1 hypothetical protein ASF12_23655 [Paenibacillus sp. Leaf72]